MRARWFRVVEHFLYWADFVTLFVVIIPGCAERLHFTFLSSPLCHPVWKVIGSVLPVYVLRAACRFITYSVIVLEFDAVRAGPSV